MFRTFKAFLKLSLFVKRGKRSAHSVEMSSNGLRTTLLRGANRFISSQIGFTNFDLTPTGKMLGTAVPAQRVGETRFVQKDIKCGCAGVLTYDDDINNAIVRERSVNK